MFAQDITEVQKGERLEVSDWTTGATGISDSDDEDDDDAEGEEDPIMKDPEIEHARSATSEESEELSESE
jgi:hypothetical protein